MADRVERRSTPLRGRRPLRLRAAGMRWCLAAAAPPLLAGVALALELLPTGPAGLGALGAAAAASVLCAVSLRRRLEPVGKIADSAAEFIPPRRAGAVPADDASRLAHGFAALAERLDEAQRRADPARLEDPLTGLPNRLGAMRRGRDEISRARRTGRSLSVALIELEADAPGADPVARDRALRLSAETMVQVLRGYDVVARWEGDIFVAMMPESEIENGVEAVRRVRDAISEDPFIEVAGGRASICAGVAVLQPDDATLAEICLRAGKALAKARERGRGRVEAAPGPRTRPGRITSV